MTVLRQGSLRQHGELMIDHRASPGIPEDLARSLGMDPAMVKEGRLLEAATLTCAHCKTAAMKNPLRTRERASCGKCGYHYICDNCAVAMRLPDYTHAPYEKIVEDAAKGVILGSPRDLLSTPGIILP